jgi:D-sedoheptulose 7-phosphate isomerase
MFTDLKTHKIENLQNFFQQSQGAYRELMESSSLHDQLCAVSSIIGDAYSKGGCLYIAGNGGSAADAQHISGELVGRLKQERTPIRAYCLNTDTALMTAIGNDYGYDKIFSRQVEGVMTSQDVFLAITTSGNSQNILSALRSSKNIGATSVLLSGQEGGEAKKLANYSLLAPHTSTPIIQQCHMAMYHTLCYMIEVELIERGLCKYI